MRSADYHSAVAAAPSRSAPGRRRLTTVLLAATSAVAVAGAITLIPLAVPAVADPIEACTASSGAVVAVDFGHWDGPVVRGCDATPTTGMDLLHEAGFTTTGTVHDGPGFICRIGTAGFNSGTEYPTPADEACQLTPLPTAYWSYWLAPAGQDHWTYSPLGALSQRPQPGQVEAWVFGGTDIGGTTGQPTFTPASVRATNPGRTTPGTPSASSTPSPTPSTPAGVAVARGAEYLVEQLVDGNHIYNEAWGTIDFALTAKVGIALAASESHDPTLTAIVDYLAGRAAEYAYPGGVGSPPNSGAVANLALLAEITGGDPAAFGGHDLLTALTDHLCPAPGGDGNCTDTGDFYGAASPGAQALGILTLARANLPVPTAAVDRLSQMQCTDGGFSGAMIRQGEPCESEPATTGTVVQALTLVPDAVDTVAEAKTYLLGQQRPDGSFPPYLGAQGGDTGTTALAAQAMLVLAQPTPAASAQNWLIARQGDDGGFGGDENTVDSDPYATVLAVPALAGATLTTLRHDPSDPEPTPTASPTPSSSATPSTSPSTSPPPSGPIPDLVKGVAYLVAPANLLHGHYYESVPGTGSADFGLTIDGAYALAATGGNDPALAKIVAFLDQRGTDGAGRTISSWTSVGTPYANGGSIAKTALLAEVVGRNPRAFAGHDLIAALDAAVCTQATTDPNRRCAGAGNYANATSVFSQALGIMAQLRAGETTKAAAPTSFLMDLQSPSGSWPSLIPAPSATDGDVDSTAMAAMALDLVPGDDAAAAVDKGLAWIASTQLADGGFPGAAGNSVNSAALAIQGLSLDQQRYATQIARARGFLAAQQNSDGGFNVASTGQRGSDVRASTQAVGGTVGTSFGVLHRDLSAVPVPSSTPSPPGGQGGSQSPLPLTGDNVLRLVWLAIALLGGGAALVTATRRQRRAVEEVQS
ncbi:prenyltransferase/squalene oxidase repeat-containing protein [Micromonospora sp. NPDC050397]|uniref:prenyltransferase/squalene oxidase repeat-containing protein n=1 Tax=Micromonospora sp. NPDC050397 TaxID=3364279 RepID=UPI003850AF44